MIYTTTPADTPRFRIPVFDSEQRRTPGISPILNSTYAIVLAGGRGTRLHQLTDWRAKPAEDAQVLDRASRSGRQEKRRALALAPNPVRRSSGKTSAYRAAQAMDEKLSARGVIRCVRGYKEEGTTTTPFDMAVLNDIDRFHLVMDVADRVPQVGARAAYLKQLMRDKRLEHRQYITRHGQDMPEVRDWKWTAHVNA